MDKRIKDEVCRRLKEGAGATELSREFQVEIWEVQYLQSQIRSPVPMVFEPGDRVKLKNSETYAVVQSLVEGGAILSDGRRQWRASFNQFCYEPTEEQIRQRGAIVWDAHVSAMRGKGI